MDFKTMDVNTVLTGVTEGGVKYLKLFIQEYTSIFHETINPGCSKCITEYLRRYQKHFNDMANTNDSGYRLKLKYENIPLEFGSRILVNNSNLTKEYAEKLLEQEGGERYFDVMPEPTKTTQEPKKDEGSKTKSSGEISEPTIESLTKAVNEAERNLKALPENAHHKKRKAAESALKQAKERLEEFTKA